MAIDVDVEEPQLPEPPRDYDPEQMREIIAELVRQLRLMVVAIQDIASRVS